MLVRTAGPNIFRDQPEPGSKLGRPSERWTYAAIRTVTAPAAGSTATAAFTAPSFNAERLAQQPAERTWDKEQAQWRVCCSRWFDPGTQEVKEIRDRLAKRLEIDFVAPVGANEL
jgi:hypothetical protein